MSMNGRPKLHVVTREGELLASTRRSYDELVGLLSDASELLTRQRRVIEALKLGLAERDAHIEELEAEL